MTSLRRTSAAVAADASSRRADYLLSVGDHLWPGSRIEIDRTSGPGHREYVVVPNRSNARLLVPRNARGAAATASLRSGEATSLRRKAARRAVATLFRVGLGPVVMRDRLTAPRGSPGDQGIEEHLAEILSAVPDLRAGVRIGVQIGPARANRKPVLLVMSPRGRLVGFAKLGVNGLTDSLVKWEGAALDQLAGQDLRTTLVPSRLHSGSWNNHEILVQSALPVGRHRVVAPERVRAAQMEIATAAGTHTRPLAGSAYLYGLRKRLAALDDSVAGVLNRACDHLERETGDQELVFGAWHGDWTPWNMATTREGVLVWDWERYITDVPVGLDAAHFRLQRDVVSQGVEPERAVRELLADAASTLQGFPVPREQATTVVLLYLVDIAARYAGDKQAEAGATLGVLGSWLLPAITDFVSGRTEGRPS